MMETNPSKMSVSQWMGSMACATVIWAGLSVASAAPERFEIDNEHFSVGFLVDHIGYAQQLGQFLEGSGSFVYDPDTDELISGEVVIEADSVFTNHRRRDRHLTGGDFLDARSHSEIRFVASAWDPATGILSGDLTLLGQTHPVELQATVNKLEDYPFGHGKPTLGVSIRASINRSQWGMTYGIEQGMVGDEVALLIELEAMAE